MIRFALLSLLLAISAPAVAQVNALPPTRHILVYGDAQARAIPDRFKIKVSFDVVDRDAGKARRKVEAYLADVIASLKAAGVDENEIVATAMSVEPRTREDEKTGEDIFVGTEVERSLTATFDRKDALERFIAGLETSRELTVSSVSTELADEAALRRALREKSIEATREKATTIARAYGAKLGALYSVSDVAPQFQYGVSAGGWPSGYDWFGDSQSLDRIQVTGSRIERNRVALQTGYVTYTDRIYAVFLLAD